VFSGRIPVVFFFVLSGFVLTRGLLHEAEPVSAWIFAARRAIRLCLPAAGALLASAVLYACFASGSWPDEAPGFRDAGWIVTPNLPGLLRQALLIGGDTDFYLDRPLWSLVHELRLSFLLPIVVLTPRFRGVAGSVALILCALVIYGTSVAGHPEIENDIMLGPSFATSVWATVYFVLPFAVGAAMSLGHWDCWRPAPEHRAIALIAGILLLCSNNDWASITASVLLILTARQPGGFQTFLRRPALVWLGRVSFSLYLIHLPVLLALANALHEALPPVVVACLALVLSLPAAWLMHRLIERPSHALARRFGRPSAARSSLRQA
jgi:peptidoglycan/LPS O-acetylase OafA/YrhL